MSRPHPHIMLLAEALYKEEEYDRAENVVPFYDPSQQQHYVSRAKELLAILHELGLDIVDRPRTATPYTEESPF